MRSLILAALAAGIAVAAAPSSAQTYDPNYPVCKRVNSDAASVDCYYTTMAQCREDARGSRRMRGQSVLRDRPGAGRAHPSRAPLIFARYLQGEPP